MEKIEDEFEHLREMIEKHGKTVSVAVGAVLVLLIAVNLYRGYQRSRVRNAAQEYAQATQTEDFENIVKKYRKTPTGPVAMLSLAKSYYNEGNYIMATEQYETFIKQFPKHPMAGAAELGMAYCMEANGRFEEALKAFDTFAQQKPEHFLAPDAVLGKARCLEQAGRLAEARQVYEDFLLAHPDSAWQNRFEDRLDVLTERIARVESPDAEPFYSEPTGASMPSFMDSFGDFSTDTTIPAIPIDIPETAPVEDVPAMPESATEPEPEAAAAPAGETAEEEPAAAPELGADEAVAEPAAETPAE
jgi:TolA-binding protein